MTQSSESHSTSGATRTVSSASPGRTRTRGLGGLDVAALVFVALIAAIHLPHPFEWDQATFLLGAKKLAAGATLYRDYWDVKQPAIYAFFLTGGRLFGFHEVGIHLFELLYQLAFALTLVSTLRTRLRNPLAVSLAPVLSIGLTYAVSGAWHLTQVEGLAGFPLYLTLWFALRAGDEDGRAWHAALSGLAAAVVVLFKLLFLPIVASFWLIALLHAVRERRQPAGQIAITRVLPALAGLMLPLLLLVGMWSRQHLLGLLAWTWFTFPARMMSGSHGTRINALFDGLTWFGLRFAPVLGFGILGATSAPVERRLRWMLLAWVVVGLGVVLAQKVSWWQYHYLLIGAPLGILAAEGVAATHAAFDRAGDARRVRRPVVAIAILLTFSGALVLLGQKVVLLARDHFALDPAHRRTYQVRQSQLYDRVLGETAFLAKPGSLPGPILVLDNPAYYYLSGRASSRTHDGVLFLDRQTREEWAAFTDDAVKGDPAYVFVEAEYLPLLGDHAAAGASFAEFLAREYREIRRSPLGVWYARAAVAR
jgi:hypothetical protein